MPMELKREYDKPWNIEKKKVRRTLVIKKEESSDFSDESEEMTAEQLYKFKKNLTNAMLKL